MRQHVLGSVLVILVAVAGCGKKKDNAGAGGGSGGTAAVAGGSGTAAAGGGTPAAAGGSDCATAIKHATSLLKAPPAGAKPEMVQYIKDATAAGEKAMITSCEHDAWKPDVLACLSAAKADTGLEECSNLLTPEQKAASEKASTDALQSVKQPGQVDGAAALAAITSLRDRMCACKDKACADALDKEWGDAEHASEGARHDDQVKAAWEKIDDEYSKCQSAITK